MLTAGYSSSSSSSTSGTAAAGSGGSCSSLPGVLEALSASGAASTTASGGPCYSHVLDEDRVSSCDMEVTVPWHAVQALSADATQLADHGWSPEVLKHLCSTGILPSHAAGLALLTSAGTGAGPGPGQDSGTACIDPAPDEGGSGVGAVPPVLDVLRSSLKAASAGTIAPLRVLTLDVQLVPVVDVCARAMDPANDPIISIACDLRMTAGAHASNGQTSGAGQPSRAGQSQSQDAWEDEMVDACKLGAGHEPMRVVFFVAGKRDGALELLFAPQTVKLMYMLWIVLAS